MKAMRFSPPTLWRRRKLGRRPTNKNQGQKQQTQKQPTGENMKTNQLDPSTRAQHGRIVASALIGLASLAAVALTMLTATRPALAGQGNPNPGVLPPQTTAYGKTYGEWGAAWWQWALSIPADRNPLTDKTGEFCGEGQSGPVWFRGGAAASRETTCHV